MSVLFVAKISAAVITGKVMILSKDSRWSSLQDVFTSSDNQVSGTRAENKDTQINQKEQISTPKESQDQEIIERSVDVPSESCHDQMTEIEAYYIEITDDTSDKSSSNEDTSNHTGGTMRYLGVPKCNNGDDLKSDGPLQGQMDVNRIKESLGIDNKKHIRVVAKVNKHASFAKRKDINSTLEDYATTCTSQIFSKATMAKNNMYTWLVFLCGLFYIIPAAQLMMLAQDSSKMSGSLDICYYNFLCRHSALVFEDFGHFLSNVSYICFGALYICLVYIRRERRRNAMIKSYYKRKNHNIEPDDAKMKMLKTKYSCRNIEYLNQCGIPEQYGIHYALGIGLIFEGILSACYHVCPVIESFQFDTSYMYIVSALMFLKIYQYRHPDITLNAYIVFSYVSMMLIFEAVGCYVRGRVYNILFLCTYLSLIFIVIIGQYFKNSFCQAMRVAWQSISGDKLPRKQSIRNIFKKDTVMVVKTGGTFRQICFFMMSVMNLGLAGFVAYKMSKTDNSYVSNYLLCIFGANTAAYSMYYLAMKCYFAFKLKNMSESISLTCWIYIALCTISGVTAMVYFNMMEKDTELSPSESRHLNAACTFGIFDKHDCWHFASAFAVFFAYMMLLTLEDNNTSTPWSNITVF